MPNRILRSIAVLLAAAGQGALAQNSDLGLLLGISFPSAEVSSSRVRSSAGASVQVNYAYQLFGSAAGELYLEFPVVLSGGASTDVSKVGVVETAGATILFVPGVRFRLPVHSRLALYGALGGGIGAFGGSQVVVSRTGFREGAGTVSPALGLGGGIDFRLTRLLSVRAEVRDFIALNNFGGAAGRHRVIGQGGFAFHF